jgi:hypothetical protein
MSSTCSLCPCCGSRRGIEEAVDGIRHLGRGVLDVLLGVLGEQDIGVFLIEAVVLRAGVDFMNQFRQTSQTLEWMGVKCKFSKTNFNRLQAPSSQRNVTFVQEKKCLGLGHVGKVFAPKYFTDETELHKTATRCTPCCLV